MLRSLMLCSAFLTATAAFAQISDGKLDIYWIDSEGGGSTLIVTPRGESVLIDSGNPGGRDSKRIYKVAKEVAQLQRIDNYVTTHFHIDHFGGAAELSTLIPIVNVWDNGIPEKDPDGSPDDARWLATIKPYREFKAAKRNIISPGKKISLHEAGSKLPLSLRCLAAKQNFV